MSEHTVQQIYDDLLKYLHVYAGQRILQAKDIHYARRAGGDEEVIYYIEDMVRRAVDNLVLSVIDEAHETDIVGGLVEKEEDGSGNINIQVGLTIARRDFHKRLKEAIKMAYEYGVQYGRAISR